MSNNSPEIPKTALLAFLIGFMHTLHDIHTHSPAQQLSPQKHHMIYIHIVLLSSCPPNESEEKPEEPPSCLVPSQTQDVLFLS